MSDKRQLETSGVMNVPPSFESAPTNLHERSATYDLDMNNERDRGFHRDLCVLAQPASGSQQPQPTDVQASRFIKLLNVVFIVAVVSEATPFCNRMQVTTTYLAADIYDLPVVEDVLDIYWTGQDDAKPI